jgi:hypothetical protein
VATKAGGGHRGPEQEELEEDGRRRTFRLGKGGRGGGEVRREKRKMGKEGRGMRSEGGKQGGGGKVRKGRQQPCGP